MSCSGGYVSRSGSGTSGVRRVQVATTTDGIRNRQGMNITPGLTIIRVPVDHGTVFGRAGMVLPIMQALTCTVDPAFVSSG